MSQQLFEFATLGSEVLGAESLPTAKSKEKLGPVAGPRAVGGIHEKSCCISRTVANDHAKTEKPQIQWRRTTYQFGCLQCKPRKGGPDVWVLRYRKRETDGSTKLASITLGTLERYPTKADALRAADSFRPSINADNPARYPVSFGALAEKYERDEMPRRYSTQRLYQTLLHKYIVPRWGDYPISEVKPFPVGEWLKDLRGVGHGKPRLQKSFFSPLPKPPLLSPTSRRMIKTLMHRLFEFAMLCGLMPITRNPMSVLRIPGSTKPQKERQVLSLDECHLLLSLIQDKQISAMVVLALCLGLRCSEIFALKWNAFDWEQLRVRVNIGIVNNHIDDVKTKYSQAYLPISSSVAEVLRAWRTKSPYPRDTDWVFASPYQRGKLPLRPENEMRSHILPLTLRAGLGRIGWHTFRHTYCTLLSHFRVDERVQQQLMRHSNLKMTNHYTHEVPRDLRKANRKVTEALLPVAKKTTRKTA